jgi:hypothetical protein
LRPIFLREKTLAAANKFNICALNLLNGVYNLGSDTLKVMLSNTVPIATNTVYANLVDLSTANGYTAGGTAVGSTATSQSSGLAELTGSNVIFTASGGSIGPFEYAILYDSTVSGGPLCLWWSYGSAVTLNTGETFTFSLTSSQILTLQ